jgi:hypothetical protein
MDGKFVPYDTIFRLPRQANFIPLFAFRRKNKKPRFAVAQYPLDLKSKRKP